MRASVLVLSSEPVGERMAGPAIRAAELARALAAEHDVTLAAPAPSRAPEEERASARGGLRAARCPDRRRAATRRRGGPGAAAHAARPAGPGCPVRIVLDLYNPIVMEVLEAVAAPAGRARSGGSSS